MTYEKYWSKHVENISDGQSLLTKRFLDEESIPKVANSERNSVHRMDQGPEDRRRLKEVFDRMGKYSSMDSMESTEDWEKFLFELGMMFCNYLQGETAFTVHEYIDAGLDINFAHPKTGRALLHNAASCTAINTARQLVDSKECEFLQRDSMGHLPYDLAYERGRDYDMCEFIAVETMRQALVRKHDLKDIFKRKDSRLESRILERAKSEPTPIR